MILAALLLLVLAVSDAKAQHRKPQLTWEGYVSGGAVLYIHGDRVDVQGRDTGAVEKPRMSVHQALPAAEQKVQLTVIRGHGPVTMDEQPSKDNEYTAVVRIDAAGKRHEFYRINLFWDPSAVRKSK